MFYAWAAIAVLLLQIFGVIPKLGRIKKDYEKAERTGNTFPASWKKDYSQSADAPSQSSSLKTKPNPLNFLLPMFITIAATFYMDIDISAGILAGILSAFILYLLQRRMSLWQLLDAALEGISKMVFVIVLFVLAYCVTGLNNDLGMPTFVIGAIEPFMKGAFLPVIAFLFCAVYGYFTGACWDLAMIIVPIVAPLAQLVGVDPLLACSAVFSGGLYGNVLCPYGDGVILSAQSCDIRPTDIMFSIAPYMIIAGIITAIMYLGAGFILR
jgi:Na+/H+ antiporter NhaC